MVQFCKSCLMPNTRPRVEFDADGVCNACHNALRKPKIDWSARRQEFVDMIAQKKAQGGHPDYDCIVPWSGGKDSSYIAHRLKFEFGMNPLLVTFSPLIPNAIAVHNREEMLKLGFDHLMVRPNQKVSRRISQRFFTERGNPKIHWDAGVNSLPVRVAVSYKIPLIFYAEHGESEYGGRVLSEESLKIRDFTEVIENQIGDDPLNWMDDEIDECDLAPYIYPNLDEVQAVGVQAMYFSYFFRWSMLQNYEYIKDKIDFRLADGGRTQGTFTNFDSLDDKIDNLYYYMQYVKFGFGRATRDACRMINNNQMDRATALQHVRDFDHEFPSQDHAAHLDYLGLDEAAFLEIIDQHRNQEIWTFEGNKWRLNFEPE